MKCWQITPYHDNSCDYAIFPIHSEEDHHKALDYAKDRLEEQWDATAHDENIKPSVSMQFVDMMMNEFEEWMGNYDCCPTPEAYSAAKAAYQAGAAAMRERCAEVAEKQEKQLHSSCHMRDFHAEGYNDACEDIAAAIRGQEI